MTNLLYQVYNHINLASDNISELHALQSTILTLKDKIDISIARLYILNELKLKPSISEKELKRMNNKISLFQIRTAIVQLSKENQIEYKLVFNKYTRTTNIIAFRLGTISAT